jgi:hypothetical protein
VTFAERAKAGGNTWRLKGVVSLCDGKLATGQEAGQTWSRGDHKLKAGKSKRLEETESKEDILVRGKIQNLGGEKEVGGAFQNST